MLCVYVCETYCFVVGSIIVVDISGSPSTYIQLEVSRTTDSMSTHTLHIPTEKFSRTTHATTTHVYTLQTCCSRIIAGRRWCKAREFQTAACKLVCLHDHALGYVCICVCTWFRNVEGMGIRGAVCRMVIK